MSQSVLNIMGRNNILNIDKHTININMIITLGGHSAALYWKHLSSWQNCNFRVILLVWLIELLCAANIVGSPDHWHNWDDLTRWRCWFPVLDGMENYWSEDIGGHKFFFFFFFLLSPGSILNMFLLRHLRAMANAGILLRPKFHNLSHRQITRKRAVNP